MFEKYDELKEIKQEIRDYIKLINRKQIFGNESLIVAVAKKMLFLKHITQLEMNSHYTRCMDCDMLLLIHALTQDSLKTFYIVYRSLIENYIRYMLALKDTDNTGVRNLFNALKKKFQTQDSVKHIQYLEGEYGKCCEFIHSNINAEYNIYQYYQDILKNDEMTDEVIKKLTKIILTFFNDSVRFIIENKYEAVDNSFYRKKQELKYLIGINNYTYYNMLNP